MVVGDELRAIEWADLPVPAIATPHDCALALFRHRDQRCFVLGWHRTCSRSPSCRDRAFVSQHCLAVPGNECDTGARSRVTLLAGGADPPGLNATSASKRVPVESSPFLNHPLGSMRRRICPAVHAQQSRPVGIPRRS